MYLSKFDECLKLVDYGSHEKIRDTAFSMIRELVNCSNYSSETKKAILIEVTYHAVLDKKAIENLVREVSPTTSMSVNYSPYCNIIKYLSSVSYLNSDTVRYVWGEMNTRYKEYRGGSPMQESMHHVPFYGYNASLLEQCLEASGEATAPAPSLKATLENL
jgi:hypothetical protein